MTTESQSNAPQETSRGPRAGFQTLWVQKHLRKLKARTAALRAQYLSPKDTF